MATQKKTTKIPTNNGRATVRDVLTAVLSLNERIDGTNDRIDETLAGQQKMSQKMIELHDSMHDLRQVTNERLHEMETDIHILKRPWLFLANGWSKAVAVGGFAAMLSGTAVRLELWRFFPGL